MSTYVSACELYGGVAVDVGQQAQTEALRVGRVCESIYCEGGLGGVKGLSYTLVQLVVGDGAPEGGLAVCHRLKACVSQVWGLDRHQQKYKLLRHPLKRNKFMRTNF